VKALVQRVTRARVTLVDDGEVAGEIGPGLCVLVGVTHEDTEETAARLAAKVHELRILRDEQSAATAGAPLLVVSQFTLYGEARKGRRPTWEAAAPREVSEPVYDAVCDALEGLGAVVARGRFGEDMQVASVNDGPITLIVESPAPPG
jgi:D-aminoacyl-tRNA deacylase